MTSDPKLSSESVVDPTEEKTSESVDLVSILAGDLAEREALMRCEHSKPHQILGPHPVVVDGEDGVVVRVFHPDAESATLLLSSEDAPLEMRMRPIGEHGFFALWLPGERPEMAYRLRLEFADGETWEREDPYRFDSTVTTEDLYFLGEGTHLRLWECLGARPRTIDGVKGFAFAVWAPNARRVSLVGNFCGWDGRLLPMRRLGHSGVFELFVPNLASGELYKYEILTQYGAVLKADPVGRYSEAPPATASRTFESTWTWRDEAWMEERARRDPTTEPMATYEVHLGSWKRHPESEERFLGYREVAPLLVEHVKKLGFNYIELLPVAEHPFSGSWGYQLSGYYKPTARFGDPDDFRYFVDYCHQNGVGVILDWVPGHFVKDAHGLARFDGTALYEHEDDRLGWHPDWDTYIFNFGRHEVRNFLVANALYWLEEFHIDGLRVDAVASMLYLDYSREEGQWVPNRYGGNENLEAIDFLRATNAAVRERCPGCFMIAEESTAWPGVTKAPSDGGLGFHFKWNMGWMHDTLAYFEVDPLFRGGCHDRLTFAMLYEYSEAYVNPLSHDEVVHGKRSLLEKMPGDRWRKFANLRTLLAYQYTRPGKKLLFMGSELATSKEWNHELPLEWYLLDDPDRAPFFRFMCDLGQLYQRSPSLWRLDASPAGFQWIDCSDRASSVLVYERRELERTEESDEGEVLAVVLNLTPVPRHDYRIGAPRAGAWHVELNSDADLYGGSGYDIPERFETESVTHDGYAQSFKLTLPPLAALVLTLKESVESEAIEAVPEADKENES